MKIRKRHRIVLLFWLPFWTVIAGTCLLVSWTAGLVHFALP